jgi:hypothetical protein
MQRHHILPLAWDWHRQLWDTGQHGAKYNTQTAGRVKTLSLGACSGTRFQGFFAIKIFSRAFYFDGGWVRFVKNWTPFE